MANELQLRQIPAEMEGMLRDFAGTEPLIEASRLLANTSNRSIALLYKLARDQAASRKGQADWATWAKLANAARSAVLAASMCREIANNLALSGMTQTESTTISNSKQLVQTALDGSNQPAADSSDVPQVSEVEGEFLPTPGTPPDITGN